jgi:membrane protein DedA with SNARE-associated domain
MKHYLKLFSIPLSVLVTFISMYIIWNVFNLPPAEVLTVQLNDWFHLYGPIVILGSAFIEGILLIGGYFPGVFIIFVSVVTATSLSEALTRIVFGTIGLILAHIVNYVLGRYGWYKLLVKFGLGKSIEEMQNKLLKKGTLAIFASYWLPKLSALTDTAAGILHMPFKKFVISSILASIFWNFLVGIVVFFIGHKAVVVVTSGGTTELIIQVLIVFVWMTILLIFDYYKRKKLLLL